MLYVWTNSTQKYVSLLPYNASFIGEFLCSVVLRFLHWLITYIIWKKIQNFHFKTVFFDNLCIQNKSLLRHYTRTISSFFDHAPKYMDFSKLSNHVYVVCTSKRYGLLYNWRCFKHENWKRDWRPKLFCCNYKNIRFCSIIHGYLSFFHVWKHCATWVVGPPCVVNNFKS